LPNGGSGTARLTPTAAEDSGRKLTQLGSLHLIAQTQRLSASAGSPASIGDRAKAAVARFGAVKSIAITGRITPSSPFPASGGRQHESECPSPIRSRRQGGHARRRTN
jgi:hypothetical protein